MSDILAELKPYFDSISLNDEEKIDELFAIYKSCFHYKTIEVKGLILSVKIHSYNPRKDGLPDFFAGYYEKFVHLVTRKINRNREFRPERANRIHWIKPILENHNDQRITYFKFREYDNSIRDYFWYKTKDYLVVLEQVKSEYILITGFCVDRRNKRYFERKERQQI